MRARTSVPLHRRRCHFLVPASASLATTLSASFVSTSRLALAPSLFANASQSWPKPEQAAGKADVSEAVRLIGAAKSIVIMCGAGCRGAAEELCALSDRLKAPLIHTVKGKDIMAYDDPAWVGGIGMIGTKPVYNAVMRCELLLMLGTDYPYSEFLPQNATIIHVDDRARVLGRRASTTL